MKFIIIAALFIGLLYVIFNFDAFMHKGEAFKFLFRNSIYNADDNNVRTQYKLVPVMRGDIYKPTYMYLTDKQQYLIYSYLKDGRISRKDIFIREDNPPSHHYVVLDSEGNVLNQMDTDLTFSEDIGVFFNITHYGDWLKTGDKTLIPYETIMNSNFDMSQEEFSESFQRMQELADIVLTRTISDTSKVGHLVECALFRINDKWSILLAGHGGHGYRFPQNTKEPKEDNLLNAVYLENKKADPYRFNKFKQTDGLKLISFQEQRPTNWTPVAAISKLPILMPEMSSGIAHMLLKTDHGSFYFKISDVEKEFLLPIYNVGVQTFRLPPDVEESSGLVFLESSKNSNVERPGCGVYVVKEVPINEEPATDLPDGLSEERFAQLPIELQVALVNYKTVTELRIQSERQLEWFPEIEYLTNLEYLEISTNMTEIPASIVRLEKLQSLFVDDNAKITKLPSEIAKMQSLKWLSLPAMDIKEIPESLRKIPNLEVRKSYM